MIVDQIIREIKIKADGRTRYAGQKPFWDETLVSEIELLRHENAKLRSEKETLLDIYLGANRP